MTPEMLAAACLGIPIIGVGCAKVSHGEPVLLRHSCRECVWDCIWVLAPPFSCAPAEWMGSCSG